MSKSPRFERVLLTRLRFIGDVVLTTPIIKSIRQAFPDAYIAYLGELPAVSLLERNPYLDELLTYDPNSTLIKRLSIYPLLRKRGFDLAIDLFCNPRSALLTYATGAGVRVGAALKSRSRLYTHRVTDDGKAKSAIDFHAQYLQAVGIPLVSRQTEIFLSEEERREARIYLQWQGIDFERPVVGLHPGASWPAKMWHAERFAELADLLIAKLGVQVVITEGPEERQLIEEISHRCVGGIKVLHVLPLRQLAAVLSFIRVYVANDSGPMHMAAAVGTRTVGIFGPGEEDIWFPYNRQDGHLVLRKDVWCHPCHLNACDKEGDEYMKCMKLLETQEVFNAVRERVETVVPSR